MIITTIGGCRMKEYLKYWFLIPAIAAALTVVIVVARDGPARAQAAEVASKGGTDDPTSDLDKVLGSDRDWSRLARQELFDKLKRLQTQAGSFDVIGNEIQVHNGQDFLENPPGDPRDEVKEFHYEVNRTPIGNEPPARISYDYGTQNASDPNGAGAGTRGVRVKIRWSKPFSEGVMVDLVPSFTLVDISPDAPQAQNVWQSFSIEVLKSDREEAELEVRVWHRTRLRHVRVSFVAVGR